MSTLKKDQHEQHHSHEHCNHNHNDDHHDHENHHGHEHCEHDHEDEHHDHDHEHHEGHEHCEHDHEDEHHGHDHGHHEGHDHGHHGHDHGHVHVAQNKLKKAIMIAAFILIAEVIGAFVSNSLALLADAGHMLTDVASLFVAFFAVKISTKIPTKSMTFGYHRITILAAMLNALTLIVLAVYIGFEAYERILNPQPVQGAILFITATIGLILNLYIGLGMRDEAHNSVNIKSAMLHVMGDAAASAGVIVAGILMYFTKWYIIDPILSFGIALIVAVGAWRIMKDTYGVLMEGVPSGIDFDKVKNGIQSIEGIKSIHDLHIWSLTSSKNALSCHLVINSELTLKKSQDLRKKIEKMLRNKFEIGHITVQFEDDNHAHDTSSICCAK